MGELTVSDDQSYDPSIHLSVSDILREYSYYTVEKGTDIYVGKTECQLCPVAAVLSYLVLRGNSPVFRFIDGKPLTKDRFTQRIREERGIASK